MSIKKINLRNATLFIFILAAAAMRLVHLGEVSSWANFSPVGAMALFGGAYFSDKRKAFLFPVITLAISDVFIYYSYFHKIVFFYDGFFWVYLSFILMVIPGFFVKKINAANIAVAFIAGIIIHWLVSDIQPWMYEAGYAKNFSGYLQCLVMAIPYEKNLILGDLIFGVLMFGGFELVKRRFPTLQIHQDVAL